MFIRLHSCCFFRLPNEFLHSLTSTNLFLQLLLAVSLPLIQPCSCLFFFSELFLLCSVLLLSLPQGVPEVSHAPLHCFTPLVCTLGLLCIHRVPLRSLGWGRMELVAYRVQSMELGSWSSLHTESLPDDWLKIEEGSCIFAPVQRVQRVGYSAMWVITHLLIFLCSHSLCFRCHRGQEHLGVGSDLLEQTTCRKLACLLAREAETG